MRNGDRGVSTLPRHGQSALTTAPAEEPLRAIVDAALDYAFFMLDPQGLVVSWNSGAARIKGYKAEEILGRHSSVFYPEEALAQGIPAYELAIAASSGRYEDEGWRLRKDGTRFWANVVITAVRGTDGRLIGFAKVTRDLTERRRAEEALREAYEKLNSVLDSMTDGILQTDRRWRVTYGNRQARAGLPDFAVGKELWECFPALVSSAAGGGTLRRVMEERTTASYEEYYAPYDEWYRVRAYPAEEGMAISFLIITEEKKLQKRLEVEQILRERRIGALSHMAGGLAHEINNPLAIIHARASDLRALAGGDDPVAAFEVRAACGSIVHTCDRAIKILRGLRGFAREAGSDPLEYASVYDIVEECVDIQEARFERYRVELRLSLEMKIPLLLCRATQIGQIVTNLLNNAFDAIDQSGCMERWVSLNVRATKEELCLEVTDSGPAIEDAARVHIMDPFYVGKERGIGQGVGLSLSSTIAEDHGGRLEVVDWEQACFRLTLPFRADPGNGAEPSATQPGELLSLILPAGVTT